MPHARQQIRDAVKGALTGLPTTGNRVFTGRTRPLAADHEPVLLIYAVEESSSIVAMGNPATLLRELTLAVEGRVVAAEPPDDDLDRIAFEVETAMAAADLTALAREWHLIATRINTQAPGESHSGEVRMEYLVQYRTTEAAADAAV